MVEYIGPPPQKRRSNRVESTIKTTIRLTITSRCIVYYICRIRLSQLGLWWVIEPELWNLWLTIQVLVTLMWRIKRIRLGSAGNYEQFLWPITRDEFIKAGQGRYFQSNFNSIDDNIFSSEMYLVLLSFSNPINAELSEWATLLIKHKREWIHMCTLIPLWWLLL